jgi:putative ABC transport system permease protein
MPFRELILLALDTLRASKLRAALTLLGIVIGVFAIIVAVTAVGVIEQSVTGTIESFGSTRFVVTAEPTVQGSDGDRVDYRPLTYAQIELLDERTRRPIGISPGAGENGVRFRAGGEVTDPNVSLYGSNEHWPAANGFELDRGRFLTDDDVRLARPMIVLGADLADKLFADRDPLGKTVSGDRATYIVIGVMKRKGETFGQSVDLMGIVPVTHLFATYGRPDRDMSADVIATSAATIQETVDEVIGALRVIRGVRPGQENNFDIQTNESLIEGFSSVAAGVQMGGAGIGLLTLLAAGIGIMNIMLVSVTERTREIGIRKALGAKRRDVLRQFLVEAVVLCQVGGVIGVVGGIGVANLLGLFFDTAGVVIPWGWVLTAFVGVTFFGVFFGVYPAAKAARLDPIEALRYE